MLVRVCLDRSPDVPAVPAYSAKTRKTRHEIELLIWAGLAFNVRLGADASSTSRLSVPGLLMPVPV